MLDQKDQETFRRVLSEAQLALAEAGLLFAVVGGVPSSVYGRPRWTHDIDLFLRPHDARKGLEIFSEAGFETEHHNNTWLYKAYKDGVLVDVIFKAEGDVYLDSEMAERLRTIDYEGVKVQAASPEDIVVVKAVVHREDTSRYWFDALSIIARTALDWDYLLWRSRVAPARMLSLLVYAVSNGLAVPKEPMAELYASVFESGQPLGTLSPPEEGEER
jgi:predicted nucleotidyltransferase